LELFLVSDRSGGLRINRAIDNIAGVIAGLPPVPDLNRINTSADLLTAVFNTYLDQDAPDMNIAEYNLPDKAEQFVYDLRCVALLIEPKNVYSFFDQTKALLEGPLDNDFIFDIYNTQLQNLVQRVKEANSSGRRGENRTCVDQKITKILSYICEKTSEANLLTYQGNPLRGLNYEITAHIEQLVSPPRETDSGPCDYAGADGDRPESGEKKRIVYTSQGLAKKLTGQRDIYRCTDNQVNAVLDDIESQDGKIIGVNLKKISDGRMTRAE